MRIILITTRLDAKRVIQSTELLKEIGFEPDYLWGAEKTSLGEFVQNFLVAPEANDLTDGEKAVAISHLLALRKVIDSDERGAIIVEDDFRLWHEGNVTPEMVHKAWTTIPEDTDFCSFAKWHVFNPDLEVIEPDQNQTHKRVKEPTYGNQAYFISKRAANHFYRENLPIRAAADVIYRFAMKDDFICRHHYPELIWHKDDSIKDD
jgi:GR25 family glycosyltransferase involved in LPS biosynthesis